MRSVYRIEMMVETPLRLSELFPKHDTFLQLALERVEYYIKGRRDIYPLAKFKIFPSGSLNQATFMVSPTWMSPSSFSPDML
jgi:hypothetical protein